MKRHAWILAGVVLVSAAGVTGAFPDKSDETEALNAALKSWETAFNKHDAKALGKLYDKDADLIDFYGETHKGRKAIEKGFAEMFAKNKNIKTRQTLVSRRFLTRKIVVENGRWNDTGHTDKTLPTSGLYSAVIVKKGGTWRVVCDRGIVPLKKPKPAK
ncbi:MAG TPA: hypothetical protein DCE47_01735 [Planctomycetaceae bacterium]|nr:hypothetical protein [Planctomycetaceae bacterium]HCC99243.1 hypothetical protein [Planctomycetaceae bacterium]|tara:strand:+ start:609 stop:1085 length:477 start_codon:yes stop_codon:yes gene_type:complete